MRLALISSGGKASTKILVFDEAGWSVGLDDVVGFTLQKAEGDDGNPTGEMLLNVTVRVVDPPDEAVGNEGFVHPVDMTD